MTVTIQNWLKKTGLVSFMALLLSACDSPSKLDAEGIGKYLSSAVSNIVMSGLIVDAYIKDATVYVDVNENGQLDSSEPNAITDGDGYFNYNTITGVNYCAVGPSKYCIEMKSEYAGKLIRSIGGVDIITDQPFVGQMLLRLPNSVTDNSLQGVVISPITSVAAFLTDTQKSALKSQLNLGAEDDLNKLDPLDFADERFPTQTDKDEQKERLKLLTNIQNTVQVISSGLSANDQTQTAKVNESVYAAIAEKIEVFSTNELQREQQLSSEAKANSIDTVLDVVVGKVSSNNTLSEAVKKQAKTLAKTGEGVDLTSRNALLNNVVVLNQTTNTVFEKTAVQTSNAASTLLFKTELVGEAINKAPLNVNSSTTAKTLATSESLSTALQNNTLSFDLLLSISSSEQIATSDDVTNIINHATVIQSTLNQPPIARAQNWVLSQDSTYTGTLSVIDPENEDLTISITSQPSQGVISQTNKLITYTPKANYVGNDQFSYQATDTKGGEASQTVNLYVNALPQMYPQEVTVTAAQIYAGNLIATDAETSQLEYLTVSQPSFGSLTLDSQSGSFRYLASASFSGVDSFRVKAFDGLGYSNTATVSVTVLANSSTEIEPITIVTTSIEATLGKALTGTLTANQSNNQLLYKLISNPRQGSLVLSSNGDYVYTPKQAALANTSDSFEIEVLGGGATSGLVKINVNLLAKPIENTPPQVVNQTFNITGQYSGALNAIDAEGDILTYALLTNVTNGVLVFNADGKFSYLPSQVYSGKDSFRFSVTDGVALTEATATFEFLGQEPAQLMIAQLGPIQNATVNIYQLNTDGSKTLKFTESTSSGNMTSAGKFNKHLDDLDVDGWYLYEVSGGQDIDVNDDGIQDAITTQNNGVINLVASKGMLSVSDVRVTAASEIVYQLVKNDLANLTELKAIMAEKASQMIQQDINGDGSIDEKDLVAYNPIVHKENLKSQYQTLIASVTSGVLAGTRDYQQTIVQVATVNTLPHITSTPSLDVKQGETYHYAITATDAENQNLIYSKINLPSWLSFNPTTAELSGIPTQTEVGEHFIQLQVSDGEQVAVQSFIITVSNVNDTPTGTVTIEGTAQQGQTLSATNTLTDADGLGTINYQWNADGQAITNATGTTHTLTQSEVGKVITVTASYTDLQGTPESITSTATATVTNTNDTPTGTVTIEGTAQQGQTLSVIENLSDLDGLGTISFQWSSSADGVSWVFLRSGSVLNLTQVHVNQFIKVTASYEDLFGALESVDSASTIAVLNINDTPHAEDDFITVNEDEFFTSTIDLVANDTDIDGDLLSVISGSFVTTQGGTLLLSSDGSYTYISALNFNGTDTVNYTVTDGTLTDVGTLTIQVVPVIDMTIVNLNTSDIQEGDASITFTATLSNAGQAEVTISTDQGDIVISAGETEGTLTVSNSNGEDVYTDASQVSATVTGVTGGNFEAVDYSSATATVNITDTLDETPLTLNDVTVNEGSGTAQITASLDYAPQTELVVALSNGATLTFGADYVAGTSVSSSAFNISDSNFEISIVSSTGGNFENLITSDIAFVTIIPINAVPVVMDDWVYTSENTAKTIPVSLLYANDFDPDVDVLSINAYQQDTLHGEVLLNSGTQVFTYTPDTDFQGQDSFTYTVTDGNGGTATATVFVNVMPSLYFYKNTFGAFKQVLPAHLGSLDIALNTNIDDNSFLAISDSNSGGSVTGGVVNKWDPNTGIWGLLGQENFSQHLTGTPNLPNGSVSRAQLLTLPFYWDGVYTLIKDGVMDEDGGQDHCSVYEYDTQALVWIRLGSEQFSGQICNQGKLILNEYDGMLVLLNQNNGAQDDYYWDGTNWVALPTLPSGTSLSQYPNAADMYANANNGYVYRAFLDESNSPQIHSILAGQQSEWSDVDTSMLSASSGGSNPYIRIMQNINGGSLLVYKLGDEKIHAFNFDYDYGWIDLGQGVTEVLPSPINRFELARASNGKIFVLYENAIGDLNLKEYNESLNTWQTVQQNIVATYTDQGSLSNDENEKITLETDNNNNVYVSFVNSVDQKRYIIGSQIVALNDASTTTVSVKEFKFKIGQFPYIETTEAMLSATLSGANSGMFNFYDGNLEFYTLPEYIEGGNNTYEVTVTLTDPQIPSRTISQNFSVEVLSN